MNSSEVHLQLRTVKIGGAPITVSTSHELCIREDEFQLSSLTNRKEVIIKDDIEVTMGNIVASGQAVRKETVNVDKSKALTLIQLIMIEIFEWYNKDCSPNLLQSMAETIYGNWYWIKLSELKLFQERMKSGFYPMMHNMSPAVLMDKLGQFADESWQLREQVGDSLKIHDADDTPREYVRNKDSQQLATSIYQFNKQYQNETDDAKEK